MEPRIRQWDANQTKAPKQTSSTAPPSSRIHKKWAPSPAITNRDIRYSEQEIAEQQKKRGSPEKSESRLHGLVSHITTFFEFLVRIFYFMQECHKNV